MELKAISGREIREDIDYNTRGVDPEDKEWCDYGKELCDTLYYEKSEADRYITELEEKHKVEVDKLATYCREQTEKLCVEMTVVDSLEQNLKALRRTIWLARAWGAKNFALYNHLWSERYKDNSNHSLAEMYHNDFKKWKGLYHKFIALADKFKEAK